MHVDYLNGGTQHHHGPFILHTLFDREGMNLAEQLNKGYQHGGGWDPFGGGKWTLGEGDTLEYPGDPKMKPRVRITFEHTDEQLLVYDHAWFALKRADGTFDVCRMD